MQCLRHTYTTISFSFSPKLNLTSYLFMAKSGNYEIFISKSEIAKIREGATSIL